MARDGSGGYSQPVSDFVAGTTAVAADVNSWLDDLGLEIANSVAKDGQSTMTGALKMGSQRITVLGDATARTDAAKVSQVQDGSYIYGTTGGTANAQTLTPSPAITAYAAGQKFRVKIGSGLTNTTAVTFQVSGIASPKDLKHHDGSALVGGELKEGMVYELTYDGTNFVMGAGYLENEIVVTKTASTSAELEFTFPTGYDIIEFFGRDLVPASQDVNLRAQVSIAAAYQTSGSYQNNYTNNNSGTVAGTLSTTDTALLVSGDNDDNGVYGIGFTMELLNNPAGTALNKVFRYVSFALNSTGTRSSRDGHGWWGGAQSAIDKIKFLMSSGNITSGVIVMRCRRSS